MMRADGEDRRCKGLPLFAQFSGGELEERLVINSPSAGVILPVRILIHADVALHARHVHEHVKVHRAVLAAMKKAGGVTVPGQDGPQAEQFIALKSRVDKRSFHERGQPRQDGRHGLNRSASVGIIVLEEKGLARQ